MSKKAQKNADKPVGFFDSESVKIPAARLGVAVVQSLVAAIVTGKVGPGEFLPPESELSHYYGVSRTVIRESIKRIEEKGLVLVAQGRGTTVEPSASWKILDPIVLSALVEHDDALGFLDELAVVRTALEGSMSAEAASRRTEAQLKDLRAAFQAMENSLNEPQAFKDADAEFHLIIMSMSDNLLAASITKILFQRARAAARFSANNTTSAYKITLKEHMEILEAIEARDPLTAEARMRDHITNAWSRRRLPTKKR